MKYNAHTSVGFQSRLKIFRKTISFLKFCLETQLKQGRGMRWSVNTFLLHEGSEVWHTTAVFTRIWSSQFFNIQVAWAAIPSWCHLYRAVPNMPLVSENVLCKCTNKQRSWCLFSTRCPPSACLLHGSLWSPMVSGQRNHHKNHQILQLLVPTHESHDDPINSRTQTPPTPPPKHSSGPFTSLSYSVQYLTHKAQAKTSRNSIFFKKEENNVYSFWPVFVWLYLHSNWKVGKNIQNDY